MALSRHRVRSRRGHCAPCPVTGGSASATQSKEAAKLKFPTDAKARHAYRHECKLAWKAQKKAAKA